MSSTLLVFAPLRIEAAALGKHPGWTVLRSGMGPSRARIAAARGLAVESRAVAVVGLCAGVSPEPPYRKLMSAGPDVFEFRSNQRRYGPSCRTTPIVSIPSPFQSPTTGMSPAWP